MGGLIILIVITANAPYEDVRAVGSFANIVMAVLMNKLTVRYYLKNGYKPVGEGRTVATEKLRIGAGTYTLIVLLGVIVIGMTTNPSKTATSRTTAVPTFEETKKAAEQGDTEAMLSLGHSYSKQGDGASAVYWYVKAAELGSSTAAFELGVIYSQGYRIPTDICAAKQWYEKADERGSSYAKLGLLSLHHPRHAGAIYRCE